MKKYIGIDIGSTSAKTVVLNESAEILWKLVQPTGWSSIDTAESIKTQLCDSDNDPDSAIVVSTGYGRVAVPYSDKCVTEITCHAKGACCIHGTDTLTVIDIGGQDTKLIAVEAGMVKDFIMNDKCSAGTGRFLEIMANTLSLRPEDMCELASHGRDTTISSMCTVFAESEVISLIGRGEKKENIAYAVVDSIIKKVGAQASRLKLDESKVCLTGGLCDIEYLRTSLSKELKTDVVSSPDGRYAGAIGAALAAMNLKKKRSDYK